MLLLMRREDVDVGVEVLGGIDGLIGIETETEIVIQVGIERLVARNFLHLVLEVYSVGWRMRRGF